MLHEIFKEFVFKFNIRNGELASQQKLNESVNILKKETDDLYNRSQIIRGAQGFEWQNQTYYGPGEIVFYQGKHWMVIEGQESINEIPNDSYKWVETVRADWTMELDPNGYVHRNNTEVYTPINDYNPATKKYVDDVQKLISKGMVIGNGLNFLPLEHTALANINHITGNGLEVTDEDYIPPYTPSAQTHPATKGYVDQEIINLAEGGSITVGNTLNSEALGKRTADKYATLERKFSGMYNGFAVKNGEDEESINATDWMRTTANGLLPYDQNEGSSLGGPLWKFKEVHSKTIYTDVTLTPNADIAEKYESDVPYDSGTVLGIGTETEVTLYEEGMVLAGVVSTDPAHKLNSEIDGVYVALKGRVPCKIMGEAKRGDYINATSSGFGIASNKKSDLTIGVCITSGNGVVEVKV